MKMINLLFGYILEIISIGRMLYSVDNKISDDVLFSCASAKAERSLSSLSCMCVYVDQNKGTPPARISWVHTKMLHHFCMTPNLPMTKKTPLPG